MTTEVTAGPARHGAGGPTRLTVLYDAGCGICRTARLWLEGRAQLVPLDFVPAGSPQARGRFPGLDHDATLRDITVVADTGELYVGDGAWLACLWALEAYRDLAHTLAAPHLLPIARAAVNAAAALRGRTSGEAVRARAEEPGYRVCDDTEAGTCQ